MLSAPIFSQIRLLVNNLTKGNYAESVQELRQVCGREGTRDWRGRRRVGDEEESGLILSVSDSYYGACLEKLRGGGCAERSFHMSRRGKRKTFVMITRLD